MKDLKTHYYDGPNVMLFIHMRTVQVETLPKLGFNFFIMRMT